MRSVAVSQRVEIIPEIGERRDSLDQSWANLFSACNLIPLLIPNNKDCAKEVLANTPVSGIVLTGGNDLVAYGGNAPERDETDFFLLQYALDHKTPLLGVCRGMQIIQHFYSIKLFAVQDHVNTKHYLKVDGNLRCVNSYHKYGTRETKESLGILATSEDGVIEAVQHTIAPVTGVMWHPERNETFEEHDIKLIKELFSNQAR